MTTDVQQLLLRIEATTELARREMAKTGVDLETLGGKADKTQQRFDQAFGKIDGAAALAKGAIVGFLGALSVDAVVGFGRAILNFADDLGTAADQAGIGVERFQTLKEALRSLELSSEQTQTVFTKLQDAIGSVQSGSASKELQASLERLGVLSRILNGEIETTEQLFDAVAAGAGRYTSQAQLVADITDVVGRKAGPAFAAAIRDGGAALRSLEDSTRAAGAVITEEMVKKLADANEVIDRFTSRTQQKFVIWSATVIEAFENAGAAATNFLSRALRAIDAGLGVQQPSAPAPGQDPQSRRARDLALLNQLNPGSLIYEQRLSDFIDRYGEAPEITVSARRPAAPEPARPVTAPTRAAPDVRDRFQGRSAAEFRLANLNTDAPPLFREGALPLVRTELEAIATTLDEIDLTNARISKAPFFQEQQLQIAAGFMQDLSFSLGAAAVGATSLGDALEQSFKRAGAALIASGILRLIGTAGSALIPGFGSIFGGFFADGGRPPLGKVSVVGERGPELFVPDVPGTIIPNTVIGGGGSNIVVNVDARGATDPALVRAAAQQAVLEAAPAIVRASQAETLGGLSRRALPGGRR